MAETKTVNKLTLGELLGYSIHEARARYLEAQIYGDGDAVRYEVSRCIEIVKDGGIIIEPANKSDTTFWGVYFIGDDGTKTIIADFTCKNDAVSFAAVKNAIFNEKHGGNAESERHSKERFINAGSECIVLERCKVIPTNALVLMPTNLTAPYVVVTGLRVGKAEWDSGSYFSNLTDAMKQFKLWL